MPFGKSKDDRTHALDPMKNPTTGNAFTRLHRSLRTTA
jgi:hypothetical protein